MGNAANDPTAGLAYGTNVAHRLRTCSFSGVLEKPDAAGEAGSIDCGSLVRIQLRVRGGAIEVARYQAHGCPATLASASQVCARITGQSVLGAAAVTEREICRDLGLVPEKRYTAAMALDALHEALTNAIGSAACDVGPPRETSPGGGVLVGMSGGVDSAVAALLLKQQGHKVVGITLTLWNDPGVADQRSCCSPESVGRARRAAHHLGIPHLALDAADAFYEQVVEYFVSEYANGRTPNPCAKCNARVRMGVLLESARRLGLSHVATGHYARLTGAPPRLARGFDHRKDQSYVLAEVSPELLEHLLFPLGEMRKPEVREIAARAGLEGDSVPESQDLCFVPDDDHRRFLRERLGDLPGQIVDGKGRVLGSHQGTYNFTIGQRRGLRVAAGDPRYVVGMDAKSRRVVLGSSEEAEVSMIRVAGPVWHRSLSGAPCAVQVRSAGAAIPVAGMERDAEELSISLAKPATGVAPGQTAVVYEVDEVIVAGTIASTYRVTGA
jgi:tRNA-specific 2-thiouridylase